ncbi:hypothetical protein BSLG_006103 [Batrachochytrium salamandrivorans]|nr:hypothetical protein BSLG_006103 [Batrachochytrium salamandrivorans]
MSGTHDAIPSWYQPVGVSLALASGFFIGVSLILQKKGLMQTKEEGLEQGNEYAYLKNYIWWIGMVCMGVGEVSNFGAYAFAPTILVTPLGAISVVVSAILSIVFLKEKINFSGITGICLCIIGATIIVLHGPSSTATETIPAFISFVMGPGSFLVNAAQGFGSSVVYTLRHWDDDNQFKQWPLYPIFVFIVFTVVIQINYLNKSLSYFSTSIVTPVYFVFFSSATLTTSAVLYQGFNVASVIDGVSIILGFLVIVIGVALLFQYNLKLNKMKVRFVEDINDAETDEEEQLGDQNPLKLMAESFPLNPKPNETGSGLGSAVGSGSGNGGMSSLGRNTAGHNSLMRGIGLRSGDAGPPSSSENYVRQEINPQMNMVHVSVGGNVGLVQQATTGANGGTTLPNVNGTLVGVSPATTSVRSEGSSPTFIALPSSTQSLSHVQSNAESTLFSNLPAASGGLVGQQLHQQQLQQQNLLRGQAPIDHHPNAIATTHQPYTINVVSVSHPPTSQHQGDASTDIRDAPHRGDTADEIRPFLQYPLGGDSRANAYLQTSPARSQNHANPRNAASHVPPLPHALPPPSHMGAGTYLSNTNTNGMPLVRMTAAAASGGGGSLVSPSNYDWRQAPTSTLDSESILQTEQQQQLKQQQATNLPTRPPLISSLERLHTPSESMSGSHASEDDDGYDERDSNSRLAGSSRGLISTMHSPSLGHGDAYTAGELSRMTSSDMRTSLPIDSRDDDDLGGDVKYTPDYIVSQDGNPAGTSSVGGRTLNSFTRPQLPTSIPPVGASVRTQPHRDAGVSGISDYVYDDDIE